MDKKDTPVLYMDHSDFPNGEIKQDHVYAEIVVDILKIGASWVLARCEERRQGYDRARFILRHAKKLFGTFDIGFRYKVKVNIKLGDDIKTKEKRIEYWVVSSQPWTE